MVLCKHGRRSRGCRVRYCRVASGISPRLWNDHDFGKHRGDLTRRSRRVRDAHHRTDCKMRPPGQHTRGFGKNLKDRQDLRVQSGNDVRKPTAVTFKSELRLHLELARRNVARLDARPAPDRLGPVRQFIRLRQNRPRFMPRRADSLRTAECKKPSMKAFSDNSCLTRSAHVDFAERQVILFSLTIA